MDGISCIHIPLPEGDINLRDQGVLNRHAELWLQHFAVGQSTISQNGRSFKGTKFVLHSAKATPRMPGSRLFETATILISIDDPSS